MKSKISKIMGIGFVFVLIASMLTFAAPVAADPYRPLDPLLPNMWAGFTPTPGGLPLDAWFNDPTITKVGPIAQSPVDGDIYASVNFGLPLGGTFGDWTGVEGTGSDWAFDSFQSPDYSALLYRTAAAGGSSYIELVPPTGVTFADFQAAITAGLPEYSFWYNLQNAAPTAGPQFEFHFTDPVTSGFLEVTAVGLQAPCPNVEVWAQETLVGTTPSGYGGWGEAGVAAPFFNWGPLTNLSGILAAVNGEGNVTDASGWVLDRVRVELWEPAAAGTRYSYVDDVMIAGSCYSFDPMVRFMKSTDGGRSWAPSTSPFAYFGGPVVDMVCSSLFEDVIYVTDGNYVYKSVDGGISFAYVAKDDLEKNLRGDCGITICAKPITCIDVGYDGSEKPVVFIGTRAIPGRVYTAPHPSVGDFVVGSVYWIADESFPAQWYDLELKCYSCCDPELPTASQSGCYDVYAVGCAPTFTTSSKVYAVITTDDVNCDGTATDPSTRVVSTVGTICSWNFVTELTWNCVVANTFEIRHASRIVFPSYYGTNPTLFVGVAGTYDNNNTPAVTTDDNYGAGGDVYRVTDSFPASAMALDLNVQGFISGCTGIYHTNICSLDIESDALVAGAYDNYQNAALVNIATNVYYSADSGWTWTASLKDPTGVDQTYVLFGDSIVAGTRHGDCAFSLDCSVAPGQFFNQISLINMVIDSVLDLSHAPGYLDGSSTMYVLTNELDAYLRTGTTPNTSLLRWDGTYWERVFSTFTYATGVNTALMDWVEVSPDFNSTECLYLANTSFEMFRSLDAGCSWAALTFPCVTRPEISAWIVVDLETVLASGPYAPIGEVIWKTTYHGAQPWIPFPVPTVPAGTATDGVDFDLSPTLATDSTVLFGDDTGNVYISYDLGMTWAEIMDTMTLSFNDGAYDTYVVFDPGYGTAADPGENTVYAAAGTAIGRCAINSAALLLFQDWLYLTAAPLPVCDPEALTRASGIDAAGDTALYVSDAGAEAGSAVAPQIAGTIAVSYNVGTPASCDLTLTATNVTTLSGTFVLTEPVSIVEYNLYCVDAASIAVQGVIVVEGLISGALGSATVTLADIAACTDCGVATSAITVISSVLTVTTAPVAAVSYPTGVWRTLNPMTLISEASGLNLVEFEFLASSVAPPTMLQHPIALMPSDGGSVYPDDLWLTAGSNMLWALDDDCNGSPTDAIWMWDDVLAAPVIQVSPADEAVLVTPTTTTLEWEALDAATLYEVNIYSYCPTCPLLKNLEYTVTTFLTCYPLDPVTEPLLPGTKYFWKVRVACDSPQVSKWSELYEFDTALSSVLVLCSPICGADDIVLTTNFSWDAVIGATAYELQVVAASADGTADFTGATTYTSDVNALASIPGLEYSTVYYWQVRAIKNGIAGAWAVCLFTTLDVPEEPVDPIIPVTITTEEVTPMWIWVIIGIGGALTIAVIILIVSTRRVP